MARTQISAVALRDLMHLLTEPPRHQPIGAMPSVDHDVLALLNELVACDGVAFNDYAPRRRSRLAFASSLAPDYVLRDADIRPPDPALEVFLDHFWSAPCSYPDRTGDWQSVWTIEEHCSLREWQGSAMCVERRAIGAPMQDRDLFIPLRGPHGHSRRVIFIRFTGRDFDDAERALGALLRPHLVAYLHVRDVMSRGGVPLTARQRQLLSFVADGYSNAQLARALGISAKTVRTHLQDIYARLGVHSRSGRSPRCARWPMSSRCSRKLVRFAMSHPSSA